MKLKRNKAKLKMQLLTVGSVSTGFECWIYGDGTAMAATGPNSSVVTPPPIPGLVSSGPDSMVAFDESSKCNKWHCFDVISFVEYIVIVLKIKPSS